MANRSLMERQKFLEQKFLGNRRLAEEFVFLQDPEVRKLDRWQRWKQEAEAEDRWVSWQTGDRTKDGEQQEKFRDVFEPRRKARRRKRTLEKPQYDVGREVARVERRERRAWRREVDAVEAANQSLRLRGAALPAPAPPPLIMDFAKNLDPVRREPRHWMEPPEAAYPAYLPPRPPTPRERKGKVRPKTASRPKSAPIFPGGEDPLSSRPATAATSAAHGDSGGGPGVGRADGLGAVEAARAAAALAAAGNAWGELGYRFRVWWSGYYAASNIQRCWRGSAMR